MNEFLDRIILDNTVRAYLTVLGVILFMIIVKRYVAHIFAALIFQLVKALWKDVDKKSFTNLVIKPLGFFLVILVSLITLHKLIFPSFLDIDIYNYTLKEFLHTLASIILIVSFIRLLLRIIDFIAIILHIKANRTHDTTDNQLVVFFKDFFKVILGIIGLLMILKFAFGRDIGNILTGLSLVGAAIALALRESLENLIASFIIFFDKPFSTGDTVKVHNFTGSVEKIGLRSTRIRTDQKTFITVPNKQMVDSIVDNLSMRTQRKGELRLEIGSTTRSELLNQFVEGLRKLLDRTEIETATVMLNEITSTAFTVNGDFFTGPITLLEFNKIKEEINFSVLALMEKLDLQTAGSVTDIKIIDQSIIKNRD